MGCGMSDFFGLISDRWFVFKEVLAEPFESIEKVYEFLHFASNNSSLQLKGIEALEGHELLSLFNFIRIQALRVEEVFPALKIQFLIASCKISFSREQLLTLLCNMVLLTFQPTQRHVYWVNFENWLCDGRPCAMAYLNGLFTYFARAQKRINSEWKDEIVTFERRKFSQSIFPLPKINLKPIEMSLSGKIGDFSKSIVDFANEHIGFGISGTQEEIIFGSYIELCPAMIFCCDAMNSDEAIIVQNVQRYASYYGYGLNLRFCKDNYDSTDSFNIIAMDALDFSGFEISYWKEQLSPSNLERELTKLMAGFSAFTNERIDTGHWGCGAYGGNKYLKFALQAIAASITNNSLVFCCFDDINFFNSFTRCQKLLHECSADDLWCRLLSLEQDKDISSFEELLNNKKKS